MVRAAPFALLRNSPATELGAGEPCEFLDDWEGRSGTVRAFEELAQDGPRPRQVNRPVPGLWGAGDAAFALAAGLALTSLAGPATPWNGAGHRVIALIAYDHLTPATRAPVD